MSVVPASTPPGLDTTHQQGGGYPRAETVREKGRGALDFLFCGACSRENKGPAQRRPESAGSRYRVRWPEESAPRAAVARYFDHAIARAFQLGEPDGSWSTEGDQKDTQLELLSEAHVRICYSEDTAAWLTDILRAPVEPEMGHLARLLHDRSQPLGAIAAGFGDLFAVLHGRQLRPAGQRKDSIRDAHSAVAMFRLGTARLLALVLDVLPPLRAAPADSVADVVEEALFIEVHATLKSVLLAAAGESTFGPRLQRLALDSQLLPERLGLSQALVADLGVLAPAIEAACQMPQCITPRTKLDCFLDVCEAAARAVDLEGDFEDDELFAPPSPGSVVSSATTDDLIPVCAYALIMAGLTQLPSDLLMIKLFITDECELLGRVGYGLATLEAATSFISMVAFSASISDEAMDADSECTGFAPSDAANSRDDDTWQGVDESTEAASDAVPELMVDVQPQPTARSQRRVRCSLGSARPPSHLLPVIKSRTLQ